MSKHVNELEGWVRVQDKLPKADSEIQVWDGEVVQSCAYKCAYGSGDYPVFRTFDSETHIIENVTHWKPLSDPPKHVNELGDFHHVKLIDIDGDEISAQDIINCLHTLAYMVEWKNAIDIIYWQEEIYDRSPELKDAIKESLFYLKLIGNPVEIKDG